MIGKCSSSLTVPLSDLDHLEHLSEKPWVITDKLPEALS